MSGASPGAIAASVALRHDVLARREIKIASGVRAPAVAKRTALFSDLGASATLGAKHFVLLSIGAPMDRLIGALALATRILLFGKLQNLWAQEDLNPGGAKGHAHRRSQ